MLSRRGFILAGGSGLAALSLAKAGQAAIGAARTEALAVYSRSRAPLAAARSKGDILLSSDLSATLARFERLLAEPSQRPLTLALDAADQVMFDIAKSRAMAPQAFASTSTVPVGA